jgi:hypothetical protein
MTKRLLVGAASTRLSSSQASRDGATYINRMIAAGKPLPRMENYFYKSLDVLGAESY